MARAAAHASLPLAVRRSVTPEVDQGEVLRTTLVPIEPHDTLATLEERMHAAEHEILVDCVCELLAAAHRVRPATGSA